MDYLAALNERYSQGVTPENNAAVLLLQAVGPEKHQRAIPRAVLQDARSYAVAGEGAVLRAVHGRISNRKTAASEPPMDGLRVGRLGESPRENRDRITERPWSKEDSPIAAAWLEENQKQIDLVVAATNRPRYYFPLADADVRDG